PADAESELYRIAGEALTNVRKHAGAREASLRLDGVRHHVRLTGAGARARLPVRRPRRRGLGLLRLEGRAAACRRRGTDRPAPGRGTSVTVTVPVGARRPSPQVAKSPTR